MTHVERVFPRLDPARLCHIKDCRQIRFNPFATLSGMTDRYSRTAANSGDGFESSP
jgi:hypothetical protein